MRITSLLSRAEKFGFKDLAAVHWNLPAEQLYEFALAANEGHVVEGGAFCALVSGPAATKSARRISDAPR